MFNRTMAALVMSAVLVAGCTTGLHEAPIGHAVPVPEWSGEFNNVFRDGDVIFAGRPASDAIYTTARSGVHTVVDLLPGSEQASLVDFNEQQLVERLGMRYVNIPVTPETFSTEDVDRFADVLKTADGPVLVHCSSANRSGGIWAAYLVLHRGFAMDEAIACGREAGLSRDSMVEAVERVCQPAEPAEPESGEAPSAPKG